VFQASQICLVQLVFHLQPNAFRKDLAGCIELCYHLLYQSPIFQHRCWLFVICLELKIILIVKLEISCPHLISQFGNDEV
jgi:hypothetical protein